MNGVSYRKYKVKRERGKITNKGLFTLLHACLLVVNKVLLKIMHAQRSTNILQHVGNSMDLRYDRMP